MQICQKLLLILPLKYIPNPARFRHSHCPSLTGVPRTSHLDHHLPTGLCFYPGSLQVPSQVILLKSKMHFKKCSNFLGLNTAFHRERGWGPPRSQSGSFHSSSTQPPAALGFALAIPSAWNVLPLDDSQPKSLTCFSVNDTFSVSFHCLSENYPLPSILPYPVPFISLITHHQLLY